MRVTLQKKARKVHLTIPSLGINNARHGGKRNISQILKHESATPQHLDLQIRRLWGGYSCSHLACSCLSYSSSVSSATTVAFSASLITLSV